MSEKKIKAELRSEVGRNACRRLRHAGIVPAVMYSKGETPVNLKLNAKDWRALRQTSGKIVDLEFDGSDTQQVLIQAEDYNYLFDRYLHIDFLKMIAGEAITASVRVKGVGDAPGLTKGGIVDQQNHEIEVSAIPSKIPSSISVDLTGLDLDQAITAGDIKLPEGVTLTNQPKQVIFLMVESRAAASATDEAEEATTE